MFGWSGVFSLYVFNPFSDLIWAVGFAMRLGSVALVFPLQCMREKTPLWSAPKKKGADNHSASLYLMQG
jgi:hypothetical protein